MSAFVVDHAPGVPVDSYIEQRGDAPIKIYPIQEIEAAIQTITSADFDNLSESTAEAILSLVYYSENFDLLLNGRLISAIFKILTRYPDDNSVGLCSFCIL